MADYPVAKIDVAGSKFTWKDAILLSTARDGGTKARRLAAAKKRAWKLHHAFLNASEYAALESFYNTYRADTFNFTWRGVVYEVLFADSEIDFAPLKSENSDVTITLMEV
ncbi:MAG: hypothetical protein IPP91_11335 [Betaproteobacteria bacterium]|nr:hypothetical protein [Betaproteobacteria bacterium]